MDVVIVLGKGSRWQDNELRYSLRSLEKFGCNVGRVFIIGECPEWVQTNVVENYDVIKSAISQMMNSLIAPIIHIPAKDEFGHQRNIYEKLLIACNDQRVSENFLAWQDDYFLTDFIDCDSYPFYYNGTLRDRIGERIPSDGYRLSMQNTLDTLSSEGKGNLFYDIHCPITYNKEVFISTMKNADWNKRAGYTVKSLYGNFLNPISHEMPDLKFSNIMSNTEIKAKLEGRHIFSVGDMGLFKNMKEFLKESYPEKSRYEK